MNVPKCDFIRNIFRRVKSSFEREVNILLWTAMIWKGWLHVQAELEKKRKAAEYENRVEQRKSMDTSNRKKKKQSLWFSIYERYIKICKT